MDAYDICTNLGKKNLADTVAIYGRGWELFIPPTYMNEQVEIYHGLDLKYFVTLQVLHYNTK